MVQKESPIPPSSDKTHVIRTSEQWEQSSDKYHLIPRGTLCIELVPDGKMKIKIGVGDKFYSQLPYISDEVDLSNYYTKEEVDTIIENLEFMSIKSTDEYDSRTVLPRFANKLGDVRFVKNHDNPTDDPLMYIWNGSRWLFCGGSIVTSELSEYAKKSEILPRIQQLEALSHAHRNKNILDNTTAAYTTEKDQKLESLQNGVLDITQEDPEALNELTITFEDSTKVLTIPTGGSTEEYLEGQGIEFQNVVPYGTAKTINAKLGEGLSFDNQDRISNDGVLDVTEKVSEPGVITVSKASGDADIDVFDSLGRITLNCNSIPE